MCEIQQDDLVHCMLFDDILRGRVIMISPTETIFTERGG